MSKMTARVRIFLFCTFVLFYVTDGINSRNRKDFMDQVTVCCQRALMLLKKIKKSTRNPNCQTIGQLADNSSSLVCRTSAELCCVKQLQENVCQSGMSTAINGGACSAQRSLYYGREDHQECCYCCYLGMEAKRRNMGCRTSAVFGYPCQKSFTSCCLLEDPHPSGLPDIFGTRSPTTSTPLPTILRRTCSSLGCSQSCIILSGVPTCVCRSGFEINRNGRTCNDVNECVRNGTCGQNEICKNTYGSYQCRTKFTCAAGLEVDFSGLQCQDINECLQTPCEAQEECVNSRGSYRCNPRCPNTYVFRNGRCEKTCNLGTQWDGTRCVDLNECERSGICRSNERCENTVGSYRCVPAQVRCNSGYERVGSNCEDMNECEKYGSRRLCGYKACINIPGSYRCSRCREGFQYVGSRCRDMNECDQTPCSNNEVCQNTQGSYRCTCLRGYEHVGSECQDVNECEGSPCPRNEICINIPRSYRCECRQGYERSGSKCYDVDECTKNLCPAGTTCVNRPGTYRCEKRASCRPGYRFTGGTCVDVNECQENSRRCSADRECINLPGTYRCRIRCSSGYERDPIRDDCKDINECERNNTCRAGQECQNLAGSYRCNQVSRCPSGYERFNGRCQDKDECSIPNICRPPRPNCENIAGSYRCHFEECPGGMERKRNGTCGDIDECASGQHICKPRVEKCINLEGTYSCRCNPGYTRTGSDRHCRDYDECSGPDIYCSQKCVNTEGSFRCECKQGYVLAGQRNCYDVNECSEKVSGCQQRCVNTLGSYYCQCNRGFTLHSNKKSCSDVDECSEKVSTCQQRCINTPGSYYCQCNRGFTLHKNGRTCSDVDECAKGNPCGGGRACVNTRGDYKCIDTTCPSAYYVKRASDHCARKTCELDDKECRRRPKSIRWYGQGLPTNIPPGTFSYMYYIATTGYKIKPRIFYSIKSGNVGDAFEVISRGYGRAALKNRKRLEEPRNYILEFTGEVIANGQVTATFVSYLHIFVSKYQL